MINRSCILISCLAALSMSDPAVTSSSPAGAYREVSSNTQSVINDYQCLRFDGKGNVVNAGDITALNDAQILTAEMWVRIDKFNAWRTFFGKVRNLGNRIQFQQYSEPGKIAVVVNNNADIVKEGNQAYYYTPSAEVTIGDWFHLAMVFDGTQEESKRLKLYINGLERPLQRDRTAKGKIPDRMPTTRAPLLLGAEKADGSYGYKGLMDEVRIWSVARTEAELRENMNRVLTGKESGLELYYPMYAAKDETPEAIAKLIDHAPGERHAALTSFNTDSCFVAREAEVPTAQASGLTAIEIKPESIKLGWKRGFGAANLLFVTTDSAAQLLVEDGKQYTVEAVGNGWRCVYNGNGAEAEVSGLEEGTRYYFAVVDYNGTDGKERYALPVAENARLAVTTALPVVPKSPPQLSEQNISFELPPMVLPDKKSLSLNAFASSGLPVSYMSSDTMIIKIDGSEATLQGSGTIVITASQAGNEQFAPALPLSRTIEVQAPLPPPTPAEPKAAKSFKKVPFWVGTSIAAGTGLLAAGVITAIVMNIDDDKPAAADDMPPDDPGMP